MKKTKKVFLIPTSTWSFLLENETYFVRPQLLIFVIRVFLAVG